MDRRLIASIIGGKTYGNWDVDFNFTALPIKTRYAALSQSLPVVEIPSPNYPGKDSPDANEMYFDEPFKACVKFAKDLLENEDEDGLSYLWYIAGYMDDLRLSYFTSDWLTHEDMTELEKYGFSFSERYQKEHEIVFNKILQFFDTKTEKIDYFIPNQYSETESKISSIRYFAPAATAIIALSNLLFDYQLKTVRETIIFKMLNSTNWVLRSAAYAYIYKQIDLRKNPDVVSKFFKAFSSDGYALAHGVLTNSHFHLRSSHDMSHSEIESLVTKFNTGDATKKYLLEDTGYLFYDPLHKLSGEARDAAINSYYHKRIGNIDNYLKMKKSGFSLW